MALFDSRLIHIILLLLVVIPLAYSVVFWSESATTIGQNIMANWLATMIGAGVGVLIGLEVYRWQQSREQETAREETREKENAILNALLSELRENDKKLEVRRHKTPVERALEPRLRLKDELWRALSDAGELKRITDLAVLESAATAYHCVRAAVFIEEEFVRQTGVLSVWVDTGHAPDVGDALKSELLEADRDLGQAIEGAIDAIVKGLEMA
jgi:hypothetical protein